MNSTKKGKSPFRSSRSCSERWMMAILIVQFLALIGLCFLPAEFQHDPFLLKLLVGWGVALFATVGCGCYFGMRESVAVTTAGQQEADEKDLLKYLFAFVNGGEKAKAQAAPIICELLGRLSAEELAYIPIYYWGYLCPLAQDTASGYHDKKQKDVYNPLLVAGFTAVMRLQRVESLRNIESWIDHRNVNRHSKVFVRTLLECHATLVKHHAALAHFSTLLRPASAEATPSEVLLRPISGTQPSETDAGEQLLRSSQRTEEGMRGRKEPAYGGATIEQMNGDKADG